MNEFKKFIQTMPKLRDAVMEDNQQLTWQKVYEIYDLYGPEDKFWDKYRSKPLKTTAKVTPEPEKVEGDEVNEAETSVTTSTSTTTAASEAKDDNQGIDWTAVMDYMKNVDMNKVGNGIDSLQKILGIVGSFLTDDTSPKQTRKARQVFQKFND